jgi:hypothetical protein
MHLLTIRHGAAFTVVAVIEAASNIPRIRSHSSNFGLLEIPHDADVASILFGLPAIR